MRFIILLFLCLPLWVAAQVPLSENPVDENGLPHGEWIIYYDQDWWMVSTPDSATYYDVLQFDHGKRRGTIKLYYGDGTLYSEGLSDSSGISYMGKVWYYSPEGDTVGCRVFNSNGEENYSKTIDANLDLLKSEKEPGDKVYILTILGEAFVQNEDYNKALELLNEAEKLNENELGGKHVEYPKILSFLGNLQLLTGNPAGFQKYVQKLEEVTKDLSERNIYKLSLQGYYASIKATQQMDLSDLEKVVGMMKKAYDGNPKKFVKEYSETVVILGVMYTRLNQPNKAEKYLVESLEVLEAMGQTNTPNYAMCITYLGNLRLNQVRFQDAEKLFLEAIDIYTRVLGTNNPGYTQATSLLGMTYINMNRFLEAENYFLEALEINNRTIGQESMNNVLIYINLASSYRMSGRLDKAMEYAELASAVTKKLIGENHPNYAMSQNIKALILMSMGRLKEAEAIMLKSIPVNEKLLGKKHPEYLTIINNLAIIKMKFGEKEMAKSYFQEIINNTDENNMLFTTALNNLALCSPEMEDSLLNITMNLTRDIFGNKSIKYARQLINTAGLRYEDKEYKKTFELLEEALDIIEEAGPESQSHALILRKMAYTQLRMNDKENAILNLQRAGQIGLKIYDNKELEYYSSLLTLSKVEILKGNYLECYKLMAQVNVNYMDYINEYFDYLSERERENFYNEFRSAFQGYNSISLLVDEDYPEVWGDVYNLQIQIKALLLNTSNAIKNRILESNDRVLVELFDEVKDLKQIIGFYQNQDEKSLDAQNIDLDSLRSLLIDKDRQLAQMSAYYSFQQEQPRWQDIRASLQKGEAVLEIIQVNMLDTETLLTTDSTQYIGLLITPKTKDHPELIQWSDGKNLERQLTYYRNAIQHNTEDLNSYKIFWDPIREHLKKVKKLYISPDGLFNSISFLSLKNPSTGKFVLDEMDIHMLTNSRELLDKNEYNNPNNYAVLIGNPDFGIQETPEISSQRSKLAPLPGTAEEVKNIEKLLNDHGWRSEVFLEGSATEKALKNMMRPKILHIATHGYFDPSESDSASYENNPLFRNGLLLSGAQNTLNKQSDLRANSYNKSEDGILTAFEALNLNVANTELVVLSACETGLGEIKSGEGVYGLQRAFRVAGAASIIMSLWKVDDEATQKFMNTFYKNWFATGDKRGAFRYAQETQKDQYHDPYYWGGFVMVGQ